MVYIRYEARGTDFVDNLGKLDDKNPTRIFTSANQNAQQ